MSDRALSFRNRVGRLSIASPRGPAREGGVPEGGRDLRAGQAYTEYLVVLLFGVFLCLGLVVIDQQILPEQLRIVDRLYGYIFDYYAGLVNYLSLPVF